MFTLFIVVQRQSRAKEFLTVQTHTYFQLDFFYGNILRMSTCSKWFEFTFVSFQLVRNDDTQRIMGVTEKKSFIQQRYVLSSMGFMALALGYVHRFCLSLAITEMAEHSHKVMVNSDMGTICLADISAYTNTTATHKVCTFFCVCFFVPSNKQSNVGREFNLNNDALMRYKNIRSSSETMA